MARNLCCGEWIGEDGRLHYMGEPLQGFYEYEVYRLGKPGQPSRGGKPPSGGSVLPAASRRCRFYVEKS